MDDAGHLFVSDHPVSQFVVERPRRALSDSGDGSAGHVECADELALIVRKPGFDEQDVHDETSSIRVAVQPPVSAA